jgi:hypothetical protein
MNTPNFRSSAYTGRAPRDMQAAFGPYTSREITDPLTRYPRRRRFHCRADVALYVVAACALLLVWVTR